MCVVWGEQEVRGSVSDGNEVRASGRRFRSLVQGKEAY